MEFQKNFINKNYSSSFDYVHLPRYRWYNYKEGFSPKLVEEAIKSVKIENDQFILDPFNGNGTVTLTASLNNVRSIGIEVNPFVAFISKTKLNEIERASFTKNVDTVLSATEHSSRSFLLEFSTFTELSNKNKWLFNSDILESFESAWNAAQSLAKSEQDLFKLALIGAAMDNCNAVKDGKCLKYRPNWESKSYNRENFVSSLKIRLEQIAFDLDELKIKKKAFIINDDSRIALNNFKEKFKLCLTSPPYLNSFDYTDIYRPELFLGKFIRNNKDLTNLRLKTLRSHMEIKLPNPKNIRFGGIFNDVITNINKSKYFWDPQIPIMIQSYFEDMHEIFISLKKNALKDAQLWLVVGNSIYAETEIPVDLILAEIGTRNGWKLSRIEVLRHIQRRKTKYSGNIKAIRESLIIFNNN